MNSGAEFNATTGFTLLLDVKRMNARDEVEKKFQFWAILDFH